MFNHSLMLLLIASFLLLPQQVLAAQPADEEVADQPSSVQVESFQRPEGIDIAPPVYPRKRQASGREGWVNLSLMVDAQGNPYEVAVSDSSGDASFERAAVRAIEKSQFQPATLNGEPLDAGHHIKVKFELTGGTPGARPQFVSAYNRFNTALKNQDRQQAEEELSELTDLAVHNLYEDAYLNLAKYTYFQLWGSEQQQLAALTHAIAYEDKNGYLPAAAFQSALFASFSLQIALQDYAAATVTAKKLQQLELTAAQLSSLQQAIDQIQLLKTDERAYSVTGEIGTSASWFYHLFKSNFSIDVIEGEVAELKLRCDKKYAYSRYSADIRYQITDGNGDCYLEVVGNPGSRITLTQS